MYFIVSLDNFYTTVSLLGRLRHYLYMGACGTARASSAGFPLELNIPKQDIGKYEYHALKVVTVKDSFLASWVVHICGLILRQLQFSVLYMS